MLSIETCSQMLNAGSCRYSKEDVARIRTVLYLLAGISLEQFNDQLQSKTGLESDGLTWKKSNSVSAREH
jgi:hypothetical protein